MFFKISLVVIALSVGCQALPTPIETDLSQFFVHVDPAARVAGGAPAPEGSAPYMAALTFGLVFQSFICGASLVSTRTALTAAHCTEIFGSKFGDKYIRIRVGSNILSQEDGVVYPVSHNITHPEFQRDIIKNDIALLILEQPVELSERVQPIPLSFDWVPAGVITRAAGWGRIGQGMPASQQLLELYMVTVGGPQCAAHMAAAAHALHQYAPPVEPAFELCAIHSPGHGVCNGDSGGALVRCDSRQQVGVVSWGLPCARGAPDVFARVSAYRSWLSENIVL